MEKAAVEAVVAGLLGATESKSAQPSIHVEGGIHLYNFGAGAFCGGDLQELVAALRALLPNRAKGSS